MLYDEIVILGIVREHTNQSASRLDGFPQIRPAPKEFGGESVGSSVVKSRLEDRTHGGHNPRYHMGTEFGLRNSFGWLPGAAAITGFLCFRERVPCFSPVLLVNDLSPRFS